MTMTLYWYMHWFWITLQFVLCLGQNMTSEMATNTTEQIGRAAKAIGTAYTVTYQHSTTTMGTTTPIATNKPPARPSKKTTIVWKSPLRERESSRNITTSTGNTTKEIPLDLIQGLTKESVIVNATERMTEKVRHTVTDGDGVNITSTNDSFELTERMLTDRDELDGGRNGSVLSSKERVVGDGTDGLSVTVLDSSVSASDGTNLSAAGITGITLGCVALVGVLSIGSFLLYRHRSFNRPDVLNDYCSNLDSSGYIDDTSIRDNSEEMYSLDNDSFLNSLEAMTIQNYWTDTVKHTKL